MPDAIDIRMGLCVCDFYLVDLKVPQIRFSLSASVCFILVCVCVCVCVCAHVCVYWYM